MAEDLIKNSTSVEALEKRSQATKTGILGAIEGIKNEMHESRALGEALKLDLENVKIKLEEKDQIAKDLKKEITALKNDIPAIEQLQSEVSANNETLRNARNSAENMRKMLGDRENDIKELQNSLISAEQEKSRTLQKLRAEIEMSRDLQRKINSVMNEKDKVEIEKDKAVSKKQTLEAEAARLRESVKAFEEIQDALRSARS